MGNSIGVEIFRSQVDICIAVNDLTSRKEKTLLLEKIIKRNEMKEKFVLLGGSLDDIELEESVNQRFLLIFIRISFSDFKRLILESVEELHEKIRISVMVKNKENQDSYYILKDSLGTDFERLEVVLDERSDAFDPVRMLKSNFELEDFLERYTFKSNFIKTLGIFNCLDEQEPVQFHGLTNNIIDLTHFIHINIGKSYTEFLHFTEDSYSKRVGGIEIGEYTLWGLAKILNLNIESMEDIDKAISIGNIQNCDLIVKDIYGQSYPEINLEGDSVASSLGKLQFLNHDQKNFSPEDLIKSIVILLTNQLVQKGILHSQILQENNIIISGFVTSSPKIMAAIHNTFQALSARFNVFFIKSIINTACICPNFETSY
ncbi:pantothenate kinase 4-like isoform X1 [Cryptosporidium sp. chipmunk genotype I]|uniref:pantothenate kinase 4-like isoform X1 n=1 Tax=Cryptosporidium sp. chipmunk genotype I TaxID=1280935 RepID=UPI00351A3294|nr:pantothenate kinase 4-like isoform X1 [Cryptosporidium sp. chipmunk genotype I]